MKVEKFAGARKTVVTTLHVPANGGGYDLLCIDKSGKHRTMSVYQIHGSHYAVYFSASSEENLHIYFKKSKTAAPTIKAPHKAGLLLSTKVYDASEVKSLTQFKTLWQKAKIQDRSFVDRIYSSFNRHGNNPGTLSIYDGSIKITKDGNYSFSLVSTDASFLEIDDKPIVSWPGKHDVHGGLKGQKRGDIQLKKGLHRIKYYHANSGGKLIALAAIGDVKRQFVINSDQFKHAAYAYVGGLGTKAGKQADFTWTNSFMANINGRSLQQIDFDALKLKNAKSYHWDFGDGTKGTGLKQNHFYFKRQQYKVTLTVILNNGKKMTHTQIVDVRYRFGQNENDDKRTLQALDAAVKQEAAMGIQGEGYAFISLAYYFFLKEVEAAAIMPAALKNVKKIPQTDLYPLFYKAALEVQQTNEQYELAEKCFKVILEKSKVDSERASAALHYSGMMTLCMNRPLEAKKLLSTIKKEHLPVTWHPRLLEIYKADTVLVLENYAKAIKQYENIAAIKPILTEKGLDRVVMFDYNSRYFRLRNILSQKLYRQALKEMIMLEWLFPNERLSPAINLLKTDALLGNNQPKKAAVCLQRALLAKVDDNFLPQLRIRLTEVYIILNQFIKAKNQIRLIKKESPYSKEEIKARKLSEWIDKKLEE
ncbi:MAG: PKD domain-containing protein [Lentisphaeria bacterium]|nr:PKD domain-containing protein [Lentisphaeria bacterium]